MATASASSENVNYGQTADKAIDGVVDGWPGDYTKEWASVGEGNGAWLQLNFSQAYSVNKVVMYDRPGSGTQVLAAQLTFSSGSPVSVGALDNGGAATTVTFSARTITWTRFTVTNSAGSDVGLAEMEVWQTAAKNADVSGEDDFNLANAEAPRQFSLSPIYLNAETGFQLHLPENGHVLAVMYDLTGKEIKRVYDGMMSPGRQSLRWDGKNQNDNVVGTGVYLLGVEYAGSSGRQETAVQKVILMK